MEMIQFVFPVLFTVLCFTLYDSIRKVHERKGTNKLSFLYHFTGWIFLLGLTAYFYFDAFGMNLIEVSHYLWLAIVCWIVRDMAYNLVTGDKLLYSGDGNGGFIEYGIAELSYKIGIPYPVLYNLFKLSLLIITVILEVL